MSELRYKIDEENLVRAIDALVAIFAKQSEGIGSFKYKAETDGVRYTLAITQPAVKKGKARRG